MSSSNWKEIIWVGVMPTPYNNFLFKRLREHFGESFQPHYVPFVQRDFPWVPLESDEQWIGFHRTFLGLQWKLIWRAVTRPDSLVLIAGVRSFHGTGMIMMDVSRNAPLTVGRPM